MTLKKWAAALAVVLLGADVVGRIDLVAAGLYPLNSFEQTIAIIVGTAIVIFSAHRDAVEAVQMRTAARQLYRFGRRTSYPESEPLRDALRGILLRVTALSLASAIRALIAEAERARSA